MTPFPFLIGFALVAGACVILRRTAANIIHTASLALERSAAERGQ